MDDRGSGTERQLAGHESQHGACAADNEKERQWVRRLTDADSILLHPVLPGSPNDCSIAAAALHIKTYLSAHRTPTAVAAIPAS